MVVTKKTGRTSNLLLLVRPVFRAAVFEKHTLKPYLRQKPFCHIPQIAPPECRPFSESAAHRSDFYNS